MPDVSDHIEGLTSDGRKREGSWTREPPKEPGWWFVWSSQSATMLLWQTRMRGGELVVDTGLFWHPVYRMEHYWWHPADVPEPPREEE